MTDSGVERRLSDSGALAVPIYFFTHDLGPNITWDHQSGSSPGPELPRSSRFARQNRDKTFLGLHGSGLMGSLF